jgi:hypothetical protein
MADALYLSLWYPNLRLEALAGKLTAVLGAFAAHGGEASVYAATVWPVSWSETPVFERVYGRMGGEPGRGQAPGIDPRQAVEEALELLYDDYAYEFQIGWSLWELETGNGGILPPTGRTADPRPATAGRHGGQAFDSSATADDLARDDKASLRLDPLWVREPRLVGVTGYGPLFDEGVYEQDGHIRIDFGSDAPFLEEDADLDQVGAGHVEENVRQLVELTAAAEKDSGATARLLWSELGESLAQRLAARLGAGN